MSFVQCKAGVVHYTSSFRAGARGAGPLKTALSPHSPTLVFSNALGTDQCIWDSVIEALPAGWRVLRYDERGHGSSEAAESGSDLAALSAGLSELLDRLAVGQVVLCGLSLGGLIAQQFALTHPERVLGLCLAGTAPRIGSVASWQERIERVKAGGLAAIADAAMERWFGAPYRAPIAGCVGGYRAMFERTSARGYISCVEALRDADLTARVGEIAAPALVLGAELDVATPPAQVRALAEALPNARFELLPGVGHIMCAEAPGAFASALVAFATELMNAPPLASDAPAKALGELAEPRYREGMRVRRAVLGGAHVDRALREATEFDRDFQEYITRAAWGEAWVRPGLSLETRHLLTIVMLAVLNRQDELAMHVAATRNTGVSAEQVKEALLHVAVYAGAPAGHAAMKTAKRALFGEHRAERDSE